MKDQVYSDEDWEEIEYLERMKNEAWQEEEYKKERKIIEEDLLNEEKKDTFFTINEKPNDNDYDFWKETKGG